MEIDVGTQLFCSLGECLSDICRCDMTVIRVVDRSQQIWTALHQGP